MITPSGNSRRSREGRFECYPAYKSFAGVELKSIPEHWNSAPLKFCVALNPEVLDEATNPDLEIQYLDIGNVDSNGRVLSCETIRFASAPTRARRKIRAGDTLLSTVRTYLKAIAYLADPPENLVASTGFATLRPSTDFEPRFLWRLVQSHEFVEAVVSHSEGVGYPAISPSKLGRLTVWIPPKSEQVAIADFLDCQTAKIDGLISENERIIHLLEERRTAVTLRAVTKGLDPNVPMKNSGVEWLRDVPTHWQILRVRHLAERVETGRTPPDEAFSADGIPWYSPGSFGNELVIGDADKRIVRSSALSTSMPIFPAGSILVVGIGATLGKVALTLAECTANQQINVIVPNCCAGPRYLTYSLRSQTDLLRAFSVSATLPILNQSRLKDYILAVPPMHEQIAIEKYLDIHEEQIESLEAGVRNTVDFLLEYREALISGAVTGQIDIREEVQA